MGPVAGIATAAVIDVVLPLVGAGLLLRVLHRLRRPGRGFWIGVGVYGFVVLMSVVPGLVDVFRYQGSGVIAATISALPTSLIPATFNSTVIHLFFTASQWRDGGYHAVLTLYVAGMIGWALLNATLVAGAVAAGRRVYERFESAEAERAAPAGDDPFVR